MSTEQQSKISEIHNQLINSPIRVCLTQEVNELIAFLGNKAPSKEINEIIFKLLEGYYIGFSIPKLILKNALIRAGCDDLYVVVDAFSDPAFMSAEQRLRRGISWLI